MITPQTILVQENGPQATLSGDRVVLFSLEVGCCFDLNPIASEIWQLLSQSRSVGDIYDALGRRHGIGPDILGRDVLPFLEKLLQHRLIRVAGADARP